MGNLIRPTKLQIVTREGEAHLNITIDLNINLNTGDVELAPKNTEKKIYKEREDEEKDDDKTIWQIPTFKSQDKVKFGKKKEEE